MGHPAPFRALFPTPTHRSTLCSGGHLGRLWRVSLHVGSQAQLFLTASINNVFTGGSLTDVYAYAVSREREQGSFRVPLS